MTGDVDCPFCGDDGFDLYGLMLHLTHPGWCPVFDDLQRQDPPEKQRPEITPVPPQSGRN